MHGRCISVLKKANLKGLCKARRITGTAFMPSIWLPAMYEASEMKINCTELYAFLYLLSF